MAQVLTMEPLGGTGGLPPCPSKLLRHQEQLDDTTTTANATTYNHDNECACQSEFGTSTVASTKASASEYACACQEEDDGCC